jgi:hypothetical protein
MSRRLAPLLALLAACAAAPPPPPAVDPSPTPPPSASASAAPAEAPEEPSPFTVLFHEGSLGIRVFPLGPIAVAMIGWQGPHRIDAAGMRHDPTLLLGISGYTDEKNLPDYPDGWEYLVWTGHWPDDVHLWAELLGDRSGLGADYVRKGGRFVMEPDRRRTSSELVTQAKYVSAIRARAADRGDDLLVVNGSKLGREGGDVFTYEYRTTKRPPKAARAAKGAPCPQQVGAHFDVAVVASGEIFSVGQRCAPQDRDTESSELHGPLVVERWDAARQRSFVEDLPDLGGTGAPAVGFSGPDERDIEVHLVAYARDEAYVYTDIRDADRSHPYAAHFDGARWKAISPPGPGSFRQLVRREGKLWALLGDALYRKDPGAAGAWERVDPARAKVSMWDLGPDGTLWLGATDELWKRPAGGAWERVPLPAKDAEGEPFKSGERTPRTMYWLDGVLVLHTGNDPYASDHGGGLFSTGQTGPKVAALPSAPPRSALVTPGSARCKEPFVLLYKLASSAPADYDFPLTRKALKGHTEFAAAEFAETLDHGKRYFVAFVPTAAMASEIVRIVSKEVAGSSPQFLCGKPEVTRKIRFDLRTGEVAK